MFDDLDFDDVEESGQSKGVDLDFEKIPNPVTETLMPMSCST